MCNKLILTLIISLFSIISYSQPDWQWGKRGGSASSGINVKSENGSEIVTDQNGNVYALTCISKGMPADIDGYVSNNSNNQWALSKWNCEGVHQWTKYFGGSGSFSATNSTFCIDSLGGLYFAGYVYTQIDSYPPNNLSVYFDEDIVDLQLPQSIFIAKYDTSGTFQWVHFPQADTVTVSNSINPGGTSNRSSFLGMDASPEGRLFVLAHFAPGIFSEAVVSDSMNTFKVIEYDRHGNYVNDVPFEVNVSINSMSGNPETQNINNTTNGGFIRDHRTGRFYLAMQYSKNRGELTIGNTPIESIFNTSNQMNPSLFYAAAFDSLGQNIWVHQSNPSVTCSFMWTRPAIDEEGNLYLGGAGCWANTSFLDYSINSSSYWVISLTEDGELRWGNTAVNGGGSSMRSVGYSEGIAYAADRFREQLSWGGETITYPLMNGISPGYLAKFNAATGKALGTIDTFIFTGPSAGISNLAFHEGKSYAAGEISYSIRINEEEIFSIGGVFDFFVAKHGSEDCDCMLARPDFTWSSNPGSTTVDFIYTGDLPVDSVRWEFGDGSVAYGLELSHTFSSIAEHEVSVISFGDCGLAGKSYKVTPGTVSIEEDVQGYVNIYPNPSSGLVYLKDVLIGSRLEVNNILGQQIIVKEIKQRDDVVDLSSYPAGLYIFHLIRPEGSRTSVKVLKE